MRTPPDATAERLSPGLGGSSSHSATLCHLFNDPPDTSRGTHANEASTGPGAARIPPCRVQSRGAAAPRHPMLRSRRLLRCTGSFEARGATRASSSQVASPRPAMCTTPVAPDSTRSSRSGARTWLHLGRPTWSLTTLMTSVPSARRRIVSTKFLPPDPYSQLVRNTIQRRSRIRRTSSSPASFERPYAFTGLGSSAGP